MPHTKKTGCYERKLLQQIKLGSILRRQEKRVEELKVIESIHTTTEQPLS